MLAEHLTACFPNSALELRLIAVPSQVMLAAIFWNLDRQWQAAIR
jgi:hypothetical protein